MKKEMIIGIDMGGTQVRAGIVKDGRISNIISQQINAKGSTEEVLQELYNITEQLMSKEIKGIGIGFPGLTSNGFAYDVYNIPSWKEVPLQRLLEQRFNIPVLINNDGRKFTAGKFP